MRLNVRISLTERLALEANGLSLDEQRFPGRQGRIVFAYLAAQRGRPVPRDELAEVLWGDELPTTWEKALRVLMTKLRALLEECGIDGSTALTSAFGCYQLALPAGVWIDVDAAEEAVDRAEVALAAGDVGEARARGSAAAALARRSFLPGEHGLWVEERRRDLRDLLVRALECLRDASSGAGELAEAVRYGEEVTELEPFRESGYRRLMEVHAAAGNPAEALRVYERCRRQLAEELGAYPSPETESSYRDLLQRRIERVEPEARGAERPDDAPAFAPRRTRLALAVVALVAGAVVFVAGGSVRQVAGAAPQPDGVRIALVFPRAPGAAPDDALAIYAERVRDYVQFEPTLAKPKVFAGDVARSATAVARGRFDLVLWAGDGPETSAFAPRVRALPQTHFVFLDASLETLGLREVANAAAVRFAKEESSELVGYTSGLIHARGSEARADVVSVVAHGSTRAARMVVDGFIRGARKARRDIEVQVDFVPDGAGRGRCERLANEQIDRGSDVVFVAAGRCGAGAAATARIRGAWVAGGEDSIAAGPHVLARTYSEHTRAVDAAISGFLRGTLPAGTDLVLGLVDDYAVGIDTNSAVPEWIWSAVVRHCSTIRAAAEQRS